MCKGHRNWLGGVPLAKFGIMWVPRRIRMVTDHWILRESMGPKWFQKEEDQAPLTEECQWTCRTNDTMWKTQFYNHHWNNLTKKLSTDV